MGEKQNDENLRFDDGSASESVSVKKKTKKRKRQETETEKENHKAPKRRCYSSEREKGKDEYVPIRKVGGWEDVEDHSAETTKSHSRTSGDSSKRKQESSSKKDSSSKKAKKR